MNIEDEGAQPIDVDFFGMSDDEVMNMQPPEQRTEAEEPTPPADPEPADPPADPADTDPVEPGPPADDDDDDADPDKVVDPVPPKAPAKPKEPAAPKDPAADADKDPAEAKDDSAPAEIDYKAEYLKIMAPFKANGREIKLESPEEAVKLQQMGANYTKKMQALQPTLRLVKMLENNQLLDEGQLSYLIDLHQKKPEAIQKLLADSEFDPLTADVEKAAGYVPGDHKVSENEIKFQTVLEDVESTPTGPELIQEVAKQWDDDSRQALFSDPRLLSEINDQKASGIYGRISTEIERRRVLGYLQGVPFLSAYESVGKEMQAKGLLVPEGMAPPPEAPVAKRTVVPAPAVSNSEGARAAMPPKATPSATKADFNPLAQSDEAFLKEMEGRL